MLALRAMQASTDVASRLADLVQRERRWAPNGDTRFPWDQPAAHTLKP
jgi:hypothetical protein